MKACARPLCARLTTGVLAICCTVTGRPSSSVIVLTSNPSDVSQSEKALAPFAALSRTCKPPVRFTPTTTAPFFRHPLTLTRTTISQDLERLQRVRHVTLCVREAGNPPQRTAPHKGKCGKYRCRKTDSNPAPSPQTYWGFVDLSRVTAR